MANLISMLIEYVVATNSTSVEEELFLHLDTSTRIQVVWILECGTIIRCGFYHFLYFIYWLNVNRLSLNIEKTNNIIFHPYNKPTKRQVTIKINRRRLMRKILLNT